MHPMTIHLGAVVDKMKTAALERIEDLIQEDDGASDDAFDVEARIPIPDVGTLVLRLSVDLED